MHSPRKHRLPTHPAQYKTLLWLVERAYLPVMRTQRIDGIVRVTVARKLGPGRMPLDIRQDGTLRTPHYPDRVHSNPRGGRSRSGTMQGTRQHVNTTVRS